MKFDLSDLFCAGLIMFAKSLRMSLKNGVVAKRTYKVGKQVPQEELVNRLHYSLG